MHCIGTLDAEENPTFSTVEEMEKNCSGTGSDAAIQRAQLSRGIAVVEVKAEGASLLHLSPLLPKQICADSPLQSEEGGGSPTGRVNCIAWLLGATIDWLLGCPGCAAAAGLDASVAAGRDGRGAAARHGASRRVTSAASVGGTAAICSDSAPLRATRHETTRLLCTGSASFSCKMEPSRRKLFLTKNTHSKQAVVQCVSRLVSVSAGSGRCLERRSDTKEVPLWKGQAVLC